jgi:hypothetical protein
VPEIARQVQENSHVTSEHEQGPEQDAQALPARLSVLWRLFGGSDESMLLLMPPQRLLLLVVVMLREDDRVEKELQAGSGVAQPSVAAAAQ